MLHSHDTQTVGCTRASGKPEDLSGIVFVPTTCSDVGVGDRAFVGTTHYLGQ